MKQIGKTLTLILIMGIVYFYIEGVNRWIQGAMVGYCVGDMVQSRWSLTGWSSHWMVLVGGLCGLFIGLLNERQSISRLPLLLQANIGVIGIIWPLELVSGLILNCIFRLGVWDYSSLPFNIAGQVTLIYYPIFICVAIFGIWLDDVLRHWIYGRARPAPFYAYLKKFITLH